MEIKARLAARRFLMVLILFGSSPGLASNVRSLKPGDASPAAQIDQLVWLVGHWEGGGLSGRSFETISPPVAGQMAGHFQQVSDGRVQFYEFYQFVPDNGSILLRIKHFHPDLTGWEERTQTVDFPLVAIEDGAAYFDGLTVRRRGKDGLEAYVLVRQNDREDEIRFTFRRVRQ